ncbi:hypothetical protein C0583_05320 [Candidatus Parcubacteria bacterium]|nr:MAG: hypothetical protein C0583_05320 [Candidatus Parcubacteria bacterium]
MGFFDKILSSLSGPTHTADEYTDLGEGLPWFKEYKEKGSSTLSEFFELKKENQIKIKATIGKTGFYQTKKGKRWAVIAHFTDESQKQHTFYCPDWTYDPINEYREGKTLEIFVDKNDYSKYEMPIY